jgi:hypothetical protein
MRTNAAQKNVDGNVYSNGARRFWRLLSNSFSPAQKTVI